MTTPETTPRYTFDDEPVTLADLFDANPDDIDDVTKGAIHMMAPGDTLILGGGAGAEFILRRVA